MRTLLTTSIAVAVLLLTACGPTPPPGELAASKSQRVTASAPAGDLTAAVDGTTDFGLAVYRKLGDGEGNVAFSPYSVTMALAMTYGGARGDTQAAFEQVLGVQMEQSRWHRAMNTLDRALASRGVGASGRSGKPFRLTVNNQVFAQKGYPVTGDYLDLLATEYGAGVRLLDFVTAPEPARQQINAWIDANTGGLIPELLQQGSITENTRLTLVDTIVFDAAWEAPFKKDNTADRPFTRLDGSTRQVATMSGDEMSVGHATVDGLEVVSLPYSGGEVSMLIVMPPTQKFFETQATLTAARLHTLASAAADHEQTLGVRLPKFDVRTQARLSEILTSLGLGVAFSSEADFSGMTGNRELFIASVAHEAVVKVDEDGTQAAAATAVVMAGRAAAPDFVDVNRPFFYFVRDNQTGAVLFMGRVVDP